MSQPWPHPWRLQVFDAAGSTQDEAIAAARRGTPGHLAVLARVQTAGRGSRGRGWEAPPGNLNLSLMLRPDAPSVEPGAWALRAGVALHDAVAPYATDLWLKWPNDLLRRGAKLGGILIDSDVDAGGRLDWLVIGIGLNIRSAPAIAGRVIGCLGECAPTAEVFAAIVVRELDRWLRADFALVRAAWLARAHPAGTWLDVVGVGRGRFAGLAADGALLLEDWAAPVISGEIVQAPCGAPRSIAQRDPGWSPGACC